MGKGCRVELGGWDGGAVRQGQNWGVSRTRLAGAPGWE